MKPPLPRRQFLKTASLAGIGYGADRIAAVAQALSPKPIAPAASHLPEGFGLAAKYPGDRGIERDPHVLLAEGFETGSITEVAKRWDEVSNKNRRVLALSDDVPPDSAGRHSLQVTATLGENTGGHLYKLLPRGVDTAFARFYVKFAADAGYIHHFVWLGGHRPPTRWPNPRAGTRPRGDERVSVGIEPHGVSGRYPPPGVWSFYNYWHEMKISADGKYWGNALRPATPAVVPRDRWQCVEIMLKLNSSPDASDGELALWLDGRLTAHFAKGVRRGPWTGMGFTLVERDGEPFEGFRWRTDHRLKINYFWLEHYVTEQAARQNRVSNPNPVNRVWFDHVVVSTAYVGPIAKAGAENRDKN